MAGTSKQYLYDTHINMYPPSRGGMSAQRNIANSPSRIVPYPVEDIQQPMSPVALQSAAATSPATSTHTLVGSKRSPPPPNVRYDQPFTFQNGEQNLGGTPPPDLVSGLRRFDSATANNSSTDTFQSASDVSAPPPATATAMPPPPYEETENQQFLREKLYRTASDLSSGESGQEAGSRKPLQNQPLQNQHLQNQPLPEAQGSQYRTLDQGTPRKAERALPRELQRDLSQYSDEALYFYRVYQVTVDDSPNFTPKVQMKWCETLLTYSFNTEFVSNYNINSNKLKPRLTPEEALKNQKIILEHALKVLTKLITLQYGPALYLMATLYSHQPYLDIKIQAVIVRNDAKALDYYTRAAALNESEACYRAGVCYEYQRGTPTELDKAQCLQKAVYFFDRGATQCGNTACMYKLAMLLLHGVNEKYSAQAVLQQDVKAAMHWFKKAAAESAPTNGAVGSPQAMYELAKIYERDGLQPALQERLEAAGISRDATRALQYYHRCATLCSYPLAQWRLGQCYEFGQLNLPVAANKSIAWYAKAAMAQPRGNPMAMMALSGWYLTGATGVLKPNNREAYNWARKACQAADGKLARAEYALAFYSENGIGCTPSLAEAREHYERAAAAGHAKARDRLRAGDL
ncbi:Ack1p [Lachancea thermotolerans CBS 6340]|uniref:KLTH0E10516p n=1 Tax=Lachancea thermotolerans (strain ATCC 56472 / CBS 6340 / NRRL Y-8284) TaxID=559295 RepID=C5DI85_LACTC|nr:KLTH0E10516p [Lachancea thermotolerans CBS 6340]CAR23496.1 KLTH0E10516p [Lachancea thermotolerans CBS 6340]